MTTSLSFQTSTKPDPLEVRRQAEQLALNAIDSLRQVAPEVAPVFEAGGVREMIIEQYEQILTTGEVRWEGRL